MSTSIPLPLHQAVQQPAAAPRPAPVVLLRRARPSDVPAVAELLDGFARRGLLLPRSLDQVFRHVREFAVAVDADGLAGCAALRVYSSTLGEIGALAVAEPAHGRGLGRCLVDALLDDARQLGLRRVFALTLQDGFFHRIGFHTVPVSEFPEKIAQDCSTCFKRSSCMEIAVVRDLD